jgi:Homeodomain-like domain
MAAKEILVKKYVVRLSGEERERLETLIRKGKSPARRVLKARILLKADVSEGGKGWSDNRIIEALETSPSMVYRTRKQLVEDGFEAVLSRKPRAMPAISHFRRREGGQADCLGLFQAAQRTRTGTEGVIVFANASRISNEKCVKRIQSEGEAASVSIRKCPRSSGRGQRPVVN